MFMSVLKDFSKGAAPLPQITYFYLDSYCALKGIEQVCSLRPCGVLTGAMREVFTNIAAFSMVGDASAAFVTDILWPLLFFTLPTRNADTLLVLEAVVAEWTTLRGGPTSGAVFTIHRVSVGH